jgi:hypothetical protein
MSQDDLSVANAAGSTVRADINSNLQALGSRMSGAAAPATTYAHMLWVDTTNGVVKRRNAANSGWIAVETIDESFLVNRAANTILDGSDVGKFFRATASFTQTLTAAATVADGWYVFYRIESGATITFDPNGAETIDGAATLAVVGPASLIIACNGSAFYTFGRKELASGTEQATTSGTSIDFTSIPSWVKRITINFVGVSTSGTDAWLVQLGDSGGVETTDYLGSSSIIDSVVGSANSTAGFLLNWGAAALVAHGSIVLTLEDSSDNTWCAMGVLGRSDAAGTVTCAGRKATSATLDRIRITTVGGTDTFDAGAINIVYD